MLEARISMQRPRIVSDWLIERASSKAEPSTPLKVTDTGRVASHYYIRHETVEGFNQALLSHMADEDVLHALCGAHEFEQLKVRDDEIGELEKLQRRFCPIKVASISSCIIFASLGIVRPKRIRKSSNVPARTTQSDFCSASLLERFNHSGLSGGTVPRPIPLV